MSSRVLKPARLSRRDLLRGCCALAALAVVTGLHRQGNDAASGLDDFMLVSQTWFGMPLDRQAGLACFSALHQADARLVDHVQTLAWLVRRHPGLDGPGLARLLDANRYVELQITLAHLVDAWRAQPGAMPALAGGVRTRIEHPPDGRLSGI
ncbi:sugar dehydrogenase complex small subunit [Ralstonia sp. UBA689]|uniref:sugar dehydrogenase complex small subunit n=1 Tax=Ralstonia sp. UBA689 TaxID=1947373 RepID=UPI0025E54B55|nr:sugar dehydrogenase complex small subunit [Ralstonia sp. UBA689]